MSETLIAPGPGQILKLILADVRRQVAAHGGLHPASVPLVWLVWMYFSRLAARFEALAVRVQAGIVPRPKPPRPPKSASSCAPPAPKPVDGSRARRARLPEGFGWLLRIMPGVRPLGGQIRHLLATPEMAALLETSPQACRMLRPLCQMFAIAPSPDVPDVLLPRQPGPAAASRRAENPNLPGATLAEDQASKAAFAETRAADAAPPAGPAALPPPKPPPNQA